MTRNNPSFSFIHSNGFLLRLSLLLSSLLMCLPSNQPAQAQADGGYEAARQVCAVEYAQAAQIDAKYSGDGTTDPGRVHHFFFTPAEQAESLVRDFDQRVQFYGPGGRGSPEQYADIQYTRGLYFGCMAKQRLCQLGQTQYCHAGTFTPRAAAAPPLPHATQPAQPRPTRSYLPALPMMQISNNADYDLVFSEADLANVTDADVAPCLQSLADARDPQSPAYNKDASLIRGQLRYYQNLPIGKIQDQVGWNIMMRDLLASGDADAINRSVWKGIKEENIPRQMNLLREEICVQQIAQKIAMRHAHPEAAPQVAENTALPKPPAPSENASDCLKAVPGGLYGHFKNECGYRVTFTFCSVGIKNGAWAEAFNCEAKNGMGLELIGANGIQAAHINQTVQTYWLACKYPQLPMDTAYERGKGIIGTCR